MLTRPTIVNSATFFMALSTVWGCAPLRWRSVMGATGDACTRQGPSGAEGAEGAGYFGAKRPRGAPERGGENSPNLGLRAAPATTRQTTSKRERGSDVGEL